MGVYSKRLLKQHTPKGICKWTADVQGAQRLSPLLLASYHATRHSVTPQVIAIGAHSRNWHVRALGERRLQTQDTLGISYAGHWDGQQSLC